MRDSGLGIEEKGSETMTAMSPSFTVRPGERDQPWSSAFSEPLWYAAYTWANHEKRVADQFADRSVEHFLPTFESIRRWKDRKMRIQQPLFTGYIFVRLALKDRLRVLQVPSVVRLVGFNGQPAAVSDQEIDTLRKSMIPGLQALPHPYLRVGRRVRIVRGPLIGAEGVLVRRKNAIRFVLLMDLIMRAASVEVDAADIQPIP
jgi:transcription termination/antitermination protein NusG